VPGLLVPDGVLKLDVGPGGGLTPVVCVVFTLVVLSIIRKIIYWELKLKVVVPEVVLFNPALLYKSTLSRLRRFPIGCLL
jgi:hypothetical protein